MWSVVLACTEPASPPAAAPPVQVPDPPAPTEAPGEMPDELPPEDEVPPEEVAAAFRGWLAPGGPADDERRWFSIDLLEDRFAALLDAAPLVYQELPNSPAEGRGGWIVEGGVQAATFDHPTWSIRVVQMGEHYADCASDGPWPHYTGPVFRNGVATLVAGDDADCDLVLEPAGDLVKVTWCDASFVARPRDGLRHRYQAAVDAWVRAEIARLRLRAAREPSRVVYRGSALDCVPADLAGSRDGRPRLACTPADGAPGGVWFDTDGRAHELEHLHNHCGWYAIDRGH